MKFTRDWLFDHLETDRPLDAILEALPMLGLEVESVVDRGKILAPFVIAEVVSAVQHPNADKLRLCKVNTGAGDPVQVVCGAPNARSRNRPQSRQAVEPRQTTLPEAQVRLQSSAISETRGPG